jgi:hypothetical protein
VVDSALALPYATLRNPGYRNADFSKLLSIVPAEARVASDSIWVLGNLSLLNPDLELSIVDAGTLPHTLILMKEGTVAKKVGADTPKRFVKIQHGNLVATVVLTGVLN